MAARWRRARAIRRCRPTWSATRSRPTSSAGTAPERVAGFLRELVGDGQGARPGHARQLRQLPVDRVSRRSISSIPLLQRLPAPRGGLPPLPRPAAEPRGRQAARAHRVRHRLDPRGRRASRRRPCRGRCAAAFESGVAGTFVFSWTDEWFTGGHQIEDWAFGLVDRERQPKPAFHAVQALVRVRRRCRRCHAYPRVSVVICAYNAERTMEACLDVARAAALSGLRGHRRQRRLDATRTRRDRRALSDGLPRHQPGEQGAERRAQRRHRGGHRRDRRLHRLRLRRRSRLADVPRLQVQRSGFVGRRRAELPAARGQPASPAVRRRVAGRADARAAQRRGRRAHPRLQHGVPTRGARGDRRLRSGLPRRRRRRRHLLAPAERAATRSASARRRWSGTSAATRCKAYLQAAARLRQGRGAALLQASVPLQHARPGAVARAHLRRLLDDSLLLAPAGHLLRRVRPRPVPDAVRAAVVAARVPAVHPRVERGRPGLLLLCRRCIGGRLPVLGGAAARRSACRVRASARRCARRSTRASPACAAARWSRC